MDVNAVKNPVKNPEKSTDTILEILTGNEYHDSHLRGEPGTGISAKDLRHEIRPTMDVLREFRMPVRDCVLGADVNHNEPLECGWLCGTAF